MLALELAGPRAAEIHQGITAEMTGRVCHAVELHPAYVDVAVMRWQNFTGQTATLEATGEAFVSAIPP